MIRWNIEKIKQYLKENTETVLLSDKYEGQDKLLKFKCKCGNKFERAWRIFYRGSYICKECAWKEVNRDRTYTIEFIRKFVEENSTSILLSNKYFNCKTKLKFKCECGNEFETTFDNFKNSKKRKCNMCSMPDGVVGKDGIMRPSISNCKTNDEFILELIEKRGTEFTPLEEYISAKTLIRVKHNKCGYVWRVSPDHLLNRRDNCPSCTYLGNNSKGNKAVEDYLIANNINYEKEKKFNGLKGIEKHNNLRFDFYLPILNICIEYDGEQHYKAIELFGGEAQYKIQVKNDNIKNKFCKENNITLIRIPYYELNNIPTFLDKAIMSQAIENK